MADSTPDTTDARPLGLVGGPPPLVPAPLALAPLGLWAVRRALPGAPPFPLRASLNWFPPSEALILPCPPGFVKTRSRCLGGGGAARHQRGPSRGWPVGTADPVRLRRRQGAQQLLGLGGPKLAGHRLDRGLDHVVAPLAAHQVAA